MNLKKLSNEELEKLFGQISDEMASRELDREIIDVKVNKIGKYGVENIRVYYGDIHQQGIDDINYAFYFVDKKGKEHDFYYDRPPGLKLTAEQSNDWYGLVNEFIPRGFNEACENSYEYRGTVEQAIEQLKKYGITDVKKYEP